MDKHGVKGELHERPWKNFGHNRNEALQLAKGKSDYIFFIDADGYLTYDQDFAISSLDKDFYYFNILFSGLRYSRVLLVKSSLNWEWKGVLHEYLHSPLARTSATLEGVSTVYTTEGARAKDPLKYQKDIAILEEALKEEPNNHRYVFYLAQSYRDAQENEKALKTYEERVARGGWNEEVFYSMLQMGVLKERLKRPEEEILQSYFRAFSYRPTRAEPLYRIANYYNRHRDFAKGFKIAEIASSIERPNDLLFVEDWVYQYGSDLELSICAYWTGDFEASREASLKILNRRDLPDNVKDCVQKNLGFANVKLVETSMRKAS